MDYPPVHAGHLQQIRQLNELFLNLAMQPERETTLAALPPAAGGLLADCDPLERAELASLPRALFQIHLQRAAVRPASHQGLSSAARAFTLTALLVAFNTVRESRFAARVLFMGSWNALDLLARSQLGDLIEYSARKDLITCPLLARQTCASRFLASSRQDGCLSRDVRIALAQSQSPCSKPVQSLQPVPAVAHGD